MQYDKLKEIKSLVVGPHTYRLEWDSIPVGAEYDGHCINTQRLIMFSSRLNEQPTTLAETFIHEIIHCLSTVYDLDKVSAGDEHFVEILSIALLKLLQDNPQLVAVLAGPGPSAKALVEPGGKVEPEGKISTK